MRKPPNGKVMPQVTASASNGGGSSMFAQFDFGIARPCMQRAKILC
jgi:hypothetical protein